MVKVPHVDLLLYFNAIPNLTIKGHHTLQHYAILLQSDRVILSNNITPSLLQTDDVCKNKVFYYQNL